MTKVSLLIFLSLSLVACKTKTTSEKLEGIKIGMHKSEVIELINYPNVVKDLGEEDITGKNMKLVIYDNLATIVYDCDTVVEIVIKNKKNY